MEYISKHFLLKKSHNKPFAADTSKDYANYWFAKYEYNTKLSSQAVIYYLNCWTAEYYYVEVNNILKQAMKNYLVRLEPQSWGRRRGWNCWNLLPRNTKRSQQKISSIQEDVIQIAKENIVDKVLASGTYITYSQEKGPLHH